MMTTGISQPNGFTPKKEFTLFGTKYILCKDASDSTMSFPHNRVKIQSGECIKLPNIDAYFCYMHGTIPPIPNTLEKNVDVYYVGFHKNFIDMRYLTPTDIARMHIYKSDTTDWASAFASAVLNTNYESEQDMHREPISPWIPEQKHDQGGIQLPQPETSGMINIPEHMDALNSGSPDTEQNNNSRRTKK